MVSLVPTQETRVNLYTTSQRLDSLILESEDIDVIKSDQHSVKQASLSKIYSFYELDRDQLMDFLRKNEHDFDASIQYEVQESASRRHIAIRLNGRMTESQEEIERQVLSKYGL